MGKFSLTINVRFKLEREEIRNGHHLIGEYNPLDKVLHAVDCVIFGFDGEDLKVLLIKRDFEPEKGNWSLVGGFMRLAETLDSAATRILSLYTGLDNVYMEQVATFSEVDRDPVERTISTVYYALININNHNNKLIKEFSANWFPLLQTPKLIFDHDLMVQAGLTKLRKHASTQPIGFELLPEKFTMRQLQNLYEAIWNTQLDKRNFINKIKSFNILKKLDEKDMNSSRKGSYLYQFDGEKYKQKEDSFMLQF